MAAVRSIECGPGTPSADLQFLFGPEEDLDLRLRRPYFLVPLDKPETWDAIRERIYRHMERLRQAGRPVSDMYVMSHGWHRNFFAAAQAYDRLAARLSVLLRRDLKGTRLRRDPDTYAPLILTLHWHSDPGQDQWVDKAGRKHKSEFMQKVRTVFEPNPGNEQARANFANDFEDIYDLFSRMSVHDTKALGDEGLTEKARQLTQCLHCYSITDAPNPESKEEKEEGAISTDDRIPEKCAVVWTCYHETSAVGILLDQDEMPRAFVPPMEAIKNSVKMLTSSLGTLTVLGLIWKALSGDSGRRLGKGIVALLAKIPGAQTFWQATEARVSPYALALWERPIVLLLAFGVLCVMTLWSLGALREKRGACEPAKGLPLAAVVAWAYLQVWFSLPLTLYSLITYPLGALFPSLSNALLFNERRDLRKERPRYGFSNLRYTLAHVARYPIHWVRAAVAEDSAVINWADALDAQLAFWEMQRKGVEAGRNAAAFLAQLLENERIADREHPAVHLMGHSFGGLLVANAARHLACDPALPGVTVAPEARTKLQSLTLIEGALASSWFEGEETLRRFVAGAISNVFSRYDTANSFYYPLANSGRMAAGYIGLTRIGTRLPEQTRHHFASLVRSPDLDSPSYLDAPLPADAALPRLFNLDASRLIFAGSVVSGGGHGDIYKDDILNLMWAAAHSTAPSATEHTHAVIELPTTATPIAYGH